MDARRHTQLWEEVWAEYDARQIQRAPDRGALTGKFRQARPKPPTRRAGSAAKPANDTWHLLRVMAAGGAAVILTVAWLMLPRLLALQPSLSIRQQDAPALLRQFDGPAVAASLQAALMAELPSGNSQVGGDGARRFLAGMADRMADSWKRPEAVTAWLALRARGGVVEGGRSDFRGCARRGR
jgi:hypothetical protein